MERVVGFGGFLQASQPCVSQPHDRNRGWGEIQAVTQSLVSHLAQGAASKSEFQQEGPQPASLGWIAALPGIPSHTEPEQVGAIFSLEWATHPGATTPEVDQSPAGSNFPAQLHGSLCTPSAGCGAGGRTNDPSPSPTLGRTPSLSIPFSVQDVPESVPADGRDAGAGAGADPLLPALLPVQP